MPKHELQMDIPKGMQVVNVDVNITVKSDGVKLGTVMISRGGLDWLPANNSVTSYALTWERLAQLLEREGRKKRQK